ncbi:hypothetical protein B0I35DRAFT_482823 [Stachybotrys elegans]|uniref:Uncharacterized protein n=1 Tax=Stachybotrys elegans TaxID=80388 RepID=A0A8K0SIM2_9HYPO|nr:hypothetical protein B0I35DRAFT_482823 [Stachybotrys elegans]
MSSSITTSSSSANDEIRGGGASLNDHYDFQAPIVNGASPAERKTPKPRKDENGDSEEEPFGDASKTVKPALGTAQAHSLTPFPVFPQAPVVGNLAQPMHHAQPIKGNQPDPNAGTQGLIPIPPFPVWPWGHPGAVP